MKTTRKSYKFLIKLSETGHKKWILS